MKTNRDDWVYSNSHEDLWRKVRYFGNIYENALKRVRGGEKIPDSALTPEIKWTRKIKRKLRNGDSLRVDIQNISAVNFRPFIRVFGYRSDELNEDQYQTAQIFQKNVSCEFIAINRNGVPHCVLAATKIPDYHYTGDSEVLPRYRYTPDGERIDNITDWGLKQFQKAYGKDGRHLPLEGGGRGEAAGGGDPLEVADGHPTPDLRSDPPPQGEGKARRILSSTTSMACCTIPSTARPMRRI